jgi:hypothetical protein
MQQAVLAAIAMVAAACPAGAQTPFYVEGPTLEFSSDLPWGQLELVGNERIAGVSPLRVPGPLSGDYWLRASGDGLEDQRGRVHIRLDESGPRIDSYGRPSLTETFLRATLYPGYVQYRSLERWKGVAMAGVTTASLTLTLIAQHDVGEAESARDAKQIALEQAGTVEEERLRRQELSDAREDVTFAADRRNLLLGATIACWGVNYLDALFFRPEFDVRRADPASVTLGMHSAGRLDAGLRSVVFPGLGQMYNGEPRKAALMSTAGVASAGWFLYRQDEYNESVATLRKIDGRIENATSVPEREQLEAQREVQASEVDDRWSERNVAVGVMAGVWVVAVVDAVWSQGHAWGDRSTGLRSGALDWEVDPLGGAVAARVTF